MALRFEADITEYGWPSHEFGMDGETYFLSRSQRARCLVVYADGHHDGIACDISDGSSEIVNTSLDVHCDVLYVSMVMLGFQRERVIFETEVGTLSFAKSHDLIFMFVPVKDMQ